MDLSACAQFLHVSTRTVHNWESGKHDIPYAAYKLLRLLNRMELPGQSWQGWCFYGNKLISPEGRSFEGKDSKWWSFLVRRAQMFRNLYKNGVMSNSRYSNNAAFKKAHYPRNRTGLKAVKAAEVQELVKTAYKAVTWHYRTSQR